MANTTNTKYETILRDTFRKMDGDQYQTIREAYYKAVEGLQTPLKTPQSLPGNPAIL